MKAFLLTALSVVGALTITLAQAQEAAPTKMVGGVLVSATGMTLYSFDKDVANSGKSVCNGPCAGLWPPVMAPADAVANGKMTVVTRDDGSRQWALNGKPLYAYAQDQKPGDKTGEGFKDVWHVAK